jgi:hypothetical protein
MGAEKVLEVAGIVLSAGKELIKDKGVQQFLCGTYADGSSRNVADAVHGEYLSPKQKKKYGKKRKKKKQAKFKL